MTKYIYIRRGQSEVSSSLYSLNALQCSPRWPMAKRTCFRAPCFYEHSRLLNVGCSCPIRITWSWCKHSLRVEKAHLIMHTDQPTRANLTERANAGCVAGRARGRACAISDLTTSSSPFFSFLLSLSSRVNPPHLCVFTEQIQMAWR